MELYTIRYNLYNYINKDNFDYLNLKEYEYLWKYGLIAIFVFLGLIFIYKFREIQAIGFIIIFIILLFIYTIYFETEIIFNNIENNKYLKEYENFYELSNIIFNETFDFIEDIEELNEKNKITSINQLLNGINDEYLIINIDNDIIISNNFKNFIRDYISLIKKEGNNIILDNISYNEENIYNKNSKIYKYLINKKNVNYYIDNDNLFINIDKNENIPDYNYFIYLIKYSNVILENNDDNLNFKIDISNLLYDTYLSINPNLPRNPNSPINPKSPINSDYDKQIYIINNNKSKKIYISFDINDLEKNKDELEIKNYYLNWFLQRLVRDVENDNSVYNNLYNEIKNENNLIIKIKILEIRDENKLNKNLYIKELILKEIDKFNYSQKKPNKFIYFAQMDSNRNKLLEFLLEYERVKGRIIYNMKYEDNKTYEEINDYYYNQIKKNNDLLKYVDVYKLNYVNKYLFIKDDKNELEYNDIIKKYTIENNNYYLINLEELNKINLKYKKILLEYINSKYEKNFKNFNLLFDNFDIKKSKGIKKIIDDYNYEFIKIIIISIVIITIICHIFYTELLRW